MLGRLFSHFSWYTTGSLLATLASFVTFPLLTRVFTVAEYGVLNLIAITLLLLVGIAKSGVQHAVVRFYGEVVAAGDPVQKRRYQATVLYGMAITGLVVTLIWLPVSQVLPDKLWRDPRVAGLLMITAVLVLTRSIDSAFINLLRAQERSVVFSIYQVVKKYLLLAGIVIALWALNGGLTEYYFAMLLTEVLALAGLALYMFRDGGVWRPKEFDPAVYKAMMMFGIPMIGYEMMGIVLNTGSRYVISWYQGNDAVGIYSAAYNLCEYVEGIFVVSVAQAVQPIYVRLWKTEGAQATSAFLQRSLHMYIGVGAVLIAGVSAVGEEMIWLLASAKYMAAHSIIPLIISGMVLRGSLIIFGAGIYLHMRPKIIATLVATVAIFNMALNFLLVPRWGITGAAVAMLASYVAQGIAVYYYGRRWLPVSVPWTTLLKYAGIGTAMYLIVQQVDLSNPWAGLAAKMAVGAVVFGVLAFLLDGEMRRWSGLFLAKFIAKLRTGGRVA